MVGIFVNEDEYPFAEWIVRGWKKYETRNKDMLKHLLDDRVAIVSTKRGRKPCVVGYATISQKITIPMYCNCRAVWESYYREEAMIPFGSKYDDVSNGKVLYRMSDTEKCEPYTIPNNTVYHGRSWCSWENEVEI